MRKQNPYSILLMGSLLFFIISFSYNGEGADIGHFAVGEQIHFSSLWRVAACYLFIWWLFYRLFNRKFEFNRLTVIHITGCILLALLVIGYPLWMNMVKIAKPLYLLLLIFVIVQLPLMLNLVKSWSIRKKS